jgi:ubiquinone/menaquinone biosynthesis C-methylase UbiE
MGYDVVLFDLVRENLEFAEKQARKAEVVDRVRDFVQGDIRDLSRFEDDTFDAVLCLGGPLSHIEGKEERDKAVSELIRVAKHDAPIFISVFGKFGTLSLAPARWPREIEMTKHFRRFYMDGEDYMWRGKYYAHYFTPEELEKIFSRDDFNLLEMVGLEGLATPHINAINRLAENSRAWSNWLEMHYKLCTHPIVVGMSAHILVIGRKV